MGWELSGRFPQMKLIDFMKTQHLGCSLPLENPTGVAAVYVIVPRTQIWSDPH